MKAYINKHEDEDGSFANLKKLCLVRLRVIKDLFQNGQLWPLSKRSLSERLKKNLLAKLWQGDSDATPLIRPSGHHLQLHKYNWWADLRENQRRPSQAVGLWSLSPEGQRLLQRLCARTIWALMGEAASSLWASWISAQWRQYWAQ